MAKRSYDQYCGLAHALDLVGERWTLLIVRELLTGPKRYKDLMERLPGIGTNLLAKRLKFLEQEGIVERRMLPPPASTEAYALTERGQGLEPALIELIRWGYASLGHPSSDDAYAPGWSILAMKAVFQPDRAKGVDDEYEYQIGDTVFHARVKEGHLVTGQGPAVDPDFVLKAEEDAFLALVTGQLGLEEAEQQGRLTIEGDRDALLRSFELFDLAALQQA